MSDAYPIETEPFQTILDFLRFAVSKANEMSLFYGHGTDNAFDDMMVLILRSLHLPLDCDPVMWQAKLTPSEKAHLCQQMEKRIIHRIPVPYLIHEAYFYELPFYVDERVLIPRSPIAELIKQQFSPWIDAVRVSHILDLCTGSACIAIACCHEFVHAHVDAVDISQEALSVAAINRERYGLEEQLQLIHSDCFTKLNGQQYDIIVSNPPYVGREEMETLPKEYQHEPVLALEAAQNGLAIVDKILKEAYLHLTEHGILVVEVGNSEEALIEAYPHVPFTWLDFEHGGHGVFILTHQQLKKYVIS